MTGTTLPRPTNAELRILGVLWELGPSTVRQVWEHIKEEKPMGYTTALKFLQIMTEKGLVARDSETRPHVFKAVYSEDTTQKQLVGDLMTRAFGNSAQKLVMQALSAKNVSAEELAEIRGFLDEIEKEGSHGDVVE